MQPKAIFRALAALTVISGTQAQSPAGNTLPVTTDNFIRAGTDHYLGKMVKNGSFEARPATNMHGGTL